MKKKDPKLIELLEKLRHLRKKESNFVYYRAQFFVPKNKKRKGNRKQEIEVALKEYEGF